MEPKQETDREDIFVSKKYMCQPVYLKAGPVLAGVMLIVIIVGTALFHNDCPEKFITTVRNGG